jgi:hypothetical protein
MLIFLRKDQVIIGLLERQDYLKQAIRQAQRGEGASPAQSNSRLWRPNYGNLKLNSLITWPSRPWTWLSYNNH